MPSPVPAFGSEIVRHRSHAIESMLTETIIAMAFSNQALIAATLPWLAWQRLLAAAWSMTVASASAPAAAQQDETNERAAGRIPLRQPPAKLAA